MASNDKHAGSGIALPRSPIGLYYNPAIVVGCPAGRWIICQLNKCPPNRAGSDEQEPA